MQLQSDGSFVYTPDDGFSGEDTFQYTITDADGDMDMTTVTICVEEDPNETPTAEADRFDTAFDTSVSGNVLGNDDQGDGPATVTLKEGPANGTVHLQSDGSFVYTPDAGFSGDDTFQYTITDADGDMDMTTVTICV